MEKPDFRKEVQNDIRDLKEMYRDLGVEITADSPVTAEDLEEDEDLSCPDVVRNEELNDALRRNLIAHGMAIVEKIDDYFVKTGELRWDVEVLRQQALFIAMDLASTEGYYHPQNEARDFSGRSDPEMPNSALHKLVYPDIRILDPGWMDKRESRGEVKVYRQFIAKVKPYLKQLLPDDLFQDALKRYLDMDKSCQGECDFAKNDRLMRKRARDKDISLLIWFSLKKLGGKIYFTAKPEHHEQWNDKSIILSTDPEKAAMQLANLLIKK